MGDRCEDRIHIDTLKDRWWPRLLTRWKTKPNLALSEHACVTNHKIARENCKIITTNSRYHQRRCLEAWHIYNAHAPLNLDDGGQWWSVYCQKFIVILLIDERPSLTTISDHHLWRPSLTTISDHHLWPPSPATRNGGLLSKRLKPE